MASLKVFQRHKCYKFHLSSSVDEEGGDDDVEDADHKEGDHEYKCALNVFVLTNKFKCKEFVRSFFLPPRAPLIASLSEPPPLPKVLAI